MSYYSVQGKDGHGKRVTTHVKGLFSVLTQSSLQLDAGQHPAYNGLAAMPYFDEFDLSTVDVLLVSQYVQISFHCVLRFVAPLWINRLGWREVTTTNPTAAGQEGLKSRCTNSTKPAGECTSSLGPPSTCFCQCPIQCQISSQCNTVHLFSNMSPNIAVTLAILSSHLLSPRIITCVVPIPLERHLLTDIVFTSTMPQLSLTFFPKLTSRAEFS